MNVIATVSIVVVVIAVRLFFRILLLLVGFLWAVRVGAPVVTGLSLAAFASFGALFILCLPSVFWLLPVLRLFVFLLSVVLLLAFAASLLWLLLTVPVCHHALSLSLGVRFLFLFGLVETADVLVGQQVNGAGLVVLLAVFLKRFGLLARRFISIIWRALAALIVSRFAAIFLSVEYVTVPARISVLNR